MAAFADVREHPWGYSWSKLAAERADDGYLVVHDTVAITRCDGGGLYCWRCRKLSTQHPCEHVQDVIAYRNRTQGTG